MWIALGTSLQDAGGLAGDAPAPTLQANDIAAKKTRRGKVSHVDNPESRGVASDLPWTPGGNGRANPRFIKVGGETDAR